MAIKHKFENVETVVCKPDKKNNFFSCEFTLPVKTKKVENITDIQMNHVDKVDYGPDNVFIVSQFSKEGLMCNVGAVLGGLYCVPMERKDELNV